MIKNKWIAATIVATTLGLGAVYTAANEKVLGDSHDMGLDSPTRQPAGPDNKPPEKKSDLGDGGYIRQYDEYGQPMVEVQPQEGPPYYYNQNTIQEPNPEDGVHYRDMPQWRLKEW